MTEGLSNIDFYGNKVLQLKQDADTDWYKSYKDLCAAFKKYVIQNKDEGLLEWKGS